jgi:hypothetical protein
MRGSGVSGYTAGWPAHGRYAYTGIPGMSLSSGQHVNANGGLRETRGPGLVFG